MIIVCNGNLFYMRWGFDDNSRTILLRFFAYPRILAFSDYYMKQKLGIACKHCNEFTV